MNYFYTGWNIQYTKGCFLSLLTKSFNTTRHDLPLNRGQLQKGELCNELRSPWPWQVRARECQWKAALGQKWKNAIATCMNSGGAFRAKKCRAFPSLAPRGPRFAFCHASVPIGCHDVFSFLCNFSSKKGKKTFQLTSIAFF